MYGMVNQAIEAMVTERFGENAWQRVRERAGVADPVFVTMKQYPDATTYALVGAISAETGTDAPALLRAFGRYWVEYARRGPWGAMMLSAGGNALEHEIVLRDVGFGSQVLKDLGVRKMRLLTNRPSRIAGVDGFELEVVEQVLLRSNDEATVEGLVHTTH